MAAKLGVTPVDRIERQRAQYCPARHGDAVRWCARADRAPGELPRGAKSSRADNRRPFRGYRPRRRRRLRFRGLTTDQTQWVVRTRTDMTEKLAELSHNDVARLWYKIDTDRRKRAQSEAWATAGSVGDETSVLDQLAISGDWLDSRSSHHWRYAVDGIIPEGCGLLVGPPKKGKAASSPISG